MKRRRKTPKAKLKAYLDKMWSQITKDIHGRVCIWCGSKDNIQSDHIANRWKHATRWNVDNCVILCRTCHLWKKPMNPAEWAQVVINHIGQDKYDAILHMSHTQEPVDMDKVKEYLESFNHPRV